MSPKSLPRRMSHLQLQLSPMQSVADLALQYLGDYNQNSVREIQELNPQLIDPDHIEVGQTIWLPAR